MPRHMQKTWTRCRQASGGICGRKKGQYIGRARRRAAKSRLAWYGEGSWDDAHDADSQEDTGSQLDHESVQVAAC